MLIPLLTSDSVDIADTTLIPPALLGNSKLTNLEITLPQHFEYPNLTGLCDLTLIAHCKASWNPIPLLHQLHRLELHFIGRPQLRMPSLVDFDCFPGLKTLHINGDVWAGLPLAFTGHSQSVETCVLRGRLVITSQLKKLFSRVATVKSLYLHGSHLVGQVDVSLDHLEHLSLHQVICADRQFPFRCCPQMRSLLIEANTLQSKERTVELDTMLQLMILGAAATMRNLVLRSGLPWTLSPIAIHALQRANSLRYLLLDGPILIDRRDWHMVATTTVLSMVTRVDGWTAYPAASKSSLNRRGS